MIETLEIFWQSPIELRIIILGIIIYWAIHYYRKIGE